MSESIEEIQVGAIDLKVQANRLNDNIHSFFHIHDLNDMSDWLIICKRELLKGMGIVNDWLNCLMDEVNE
jgi:hypothetical protein|tara:strand:+ start:381 stop:590 length:210 start_codon:yes stop_codon:yes gene_type:complete